jgi:putative transcriptional regulator
MNDEDFKLFMEGVKQMVEHYHGLRHDLRTTVLPLPPEQMDAAAIRALRERIGTSQAVFAMALNVSPKTVQAWETGARTPDGGNLKLLRVAEAQPEAVFGRLYQPPAQPAAEPARPARKTRPSRKARAEPRAA